MESENDVHKDNEVSSMEEQDDSYSGGGEECESMVMDDDDSSYDVDDDDDLANRYPKSYSILKEEDIRKRQEEDLTKVSAVLSISREAACLLLRSYTWSVNDVYEEWFADEEKVRKAVGLLNESPENSVLSAASSSNKEVSCGICFDSYASNSLRSASATCPHLFCEACWIAYIRTSINDGPGCLMMRCPDPSCGASVSQGMIHTLLSEEEQRKYQRYLIRSYVESSRNIKWCPGPGCDCAVEYVVRSSSGSGDCGCDVICSCSYSFCWNCMEDAHRPVDCETVAKWIFKNSSESENTTWILVNSKPCPNCKRPIEKNEGCMHMTCRPPCCFEFCWVCLGPWSKHDRKPCNVYKAANKDGGYDETERIRKMAKKALDRYLHYYERWASNHKSRQNALSDLHKMRIVHLEMLCEKQCQPKSQMKFIVEAWQQIVECRRVLKWTYAYGYYLPQHEETKKQLFEYLQGQAEAGLERLHGCVEKELSKYRDDVGPSEDFNEFRKKLAGLTSVTRNYFDNLVRALENGLSDVEADKTIPKDKPTWETEGILQDGQSQIANTHGKEIGSSSTNSGDDSGADEWACDRCTYINVGYANTCVMCHE